jgi:hypothetical protein
MEMNGCLVAEKSRAEFMIWRNYSINTKNHFSPLLRISKETFVLAPMGWAIRGDIDFIVQSYLDIIFLNFRDFGFQQKTAEKFSPAPYSGLEKEDSESLDLKNFQALFYFLVFAHLLNIMVLFGEIVCSFAFRKRHEIIERNQTIPAMTFLP